MPPTVPAVEIADHADSADARCPHCEIRALGPVDAARMRPQQLVGAVERSFVEEVLVVGRELRPERVRVAAAADRALRVGYF